MIYKSAPAWSFKPKTFEHKQTPTPSPLDYKPATTTTLNKSPSWKIGRQLRCREQKEKSPSPASYQPTSPQKNNKMGIIGKDSRVKQNVQPSPGPGTYTVEAKKGGRYISFAKKYEVIDRRGQLPGPFNYNIPNKRDKRGASIGKQQRFTAPNTQLMHPGPGNYQLNNSAAKSAINFTKAPRMSHQPPRNNTLTGPGKYDIMGDFQKNLQKSKGFTLASKNQISSSIQTPGPADYSPTHKDLETSPSISFSGKYKQKERERSPSPNQYEPLFHKTIHKSDSFSMGKAERLPLHANIDSPGPGSYLKINYTTAGAEISLGKSRKLEQKEDFPGPGSYNPNKEAILKRPATAKLGKSQRFYKIKTQTSNVSFYNSKTQFSSVKYSFSKKKKLNEKYQQSPGPGAYKSQSSLCNLPSYASNSKH